MVEPDKSGKNPLVTSAQQLRLPMPGEITDDEGEDEWEYDEDGDSEGEGWEDVPDVDSVPLGEPRSEDEQFEGVNRPPPLSGYEEAGPKKRRRRRPAVPKVPSPELGEGEVFEPPFKVLPDGTVVGPKVGEGLDEMPEGFDPPRGSAEAAAQIIYGRPPQRSGGVG
jgi:hypothetical protein